MRILRIIVLSIVVVLAAVFTFQALQTPAPTSQSVDVSSDGLESAITLALSNYELNAGNTDNVYQQQVVALWGTKDLVEVTARQNARIIENQAQLGEAIGEVAAASVQSAETNARLTKSIVMLLFALVLSVVVLGITMLDRRPQVSDEGAPGTSPAQPVGADNNI